MQECHVIAVVLLWIDSTVRVTELTSFFFRLQVFLVTGGASGIGYGTARVLIDSGARRVFITSRNFGKARHSAIRMASSCKVNALDRIIPLTLVCQMNANLL